jgi:hypothetical protein
VELAELQDREVGDGTTSVVIIAAELLKVSEQGSIEAVAVLGHHRASITKGGMSSLWVIVGCQNRWMSIPWGHCRASQREGSERSFQQVSLTLLSCCHSVFAESQ